MTCGKRQHEGLELPSTGEVPQFVPLECSLLPKTRTVDGKEESYTYPEYIAPCDSCGWDKVAPTNCPVDMSDAQVTWTEKQEIGPNEESVSFWKQFVETLLSSFITSGYANGKFIRLVGLPDVRPSD